MIYRQPTPFLSSQPWGPEILIEIAAFILIGLI